MAEPLSRQRPSWLGLDIGGANLKAATTNGFANQLAFPLWKQSGELSAAIARLVSAAPPHAGYAVTMTGELADCYESKADGVASIVAAVEQAAAGKPTRYYGLRGEFLTAEEATREWALVAASNWHALASALAKKIEPGARCLLIDVGSTTTDLIPFTAGPLSSGVGPTRDCPDDTDRLLNGTLLYQGVGRTPICAVVDQLPYRGRMCPVAAELFATTADAALLLGEAAEGDEADTADGRAMTIRNAAARMGRMVCADSARFTHGDAIAAADSVGLRMTERLVTAISGLAASAAEVRYILSGSGEWLARRALASRSRDSKITRLSDEIGDAASVCAPAWAVACLAEQGGVP